MPLTGTMPKFEMGAIGKHLGRLIPTDAMRAKCLPMRPFLDLAKRPVPTTDDYATKAQAALTMMMGNDREGCCVATTLAKELGIDTAYGSPGTPVVATDAEVSRLYHQIGGPADNGLYIPDALKWMATKGMTVGGAVHKIDGFAALDPSDDAMVDACCHWFGGLHLGVNLSVKQYQNAGDGDVWDIDGTRVIGGHSVPVTARTPDLLRIATWARQPSITRRLLRSRQWCDECYVTLGTDWWKAGGLDVNGVNVDALRAALAAVKAGGTPDIPADPNPPTPVPPTPDQTLTLTGAMSFFGISMPIELSGVLPKHLTAPRQGIAWWQVMTDVAAIVSAWAARDYAALASAVAKLLADLGVVLTPGERGRLNYALSSALCGCLRAPGASGAPL